MKRLTAKRLIGVLACLGCAATASASMAEHVERTTVDGIDLVTYQSDVKDVVVIVGALPAGDAFANSGNIAVPTLLGMMLDRGTRTLDQFAIAQKLESVGAEISFGVGTQSLEVRAKCLKKDLALVIGLIGAELRTPALAPQEFAKAKQQFIGLLQQSLDSTDARSQEEFARAVFAEGSPNRPHTIEEFIAAAKAASIEQLRAFHSAYYGPAHFTLVMAGDVTMATAREPVDQAFAGWTGGHDYETGMTAAAPRTASEVKVTISEKTSVSVILGQATGLRYKDRDALALRVATAALGHGFTGRLMASVRDKEGLTYDIGANVVDDTLTGGAWELTATFAPALLAKGVAASRRELQTWWQDGLTAQELALRKQGLVGGYQVGLSTTGGLASAILNTLLRGYDLTWLDEYPKAVDALTLADVNAAIKNHLDPSTMVLVEAGTFAPAK
jgi:zinc protease